MMRQGAFLLPVEGMLASSLPPPRIKFVCAQLNVMPRTRPGPEPGARFSKVPETFRARKAVAKSRTF